MKRLLLLVLSFSLFLCGCKKDEEETSDETGILYETGTGENPFIELNEFNVNTMSFTDERYSSADYNFDFNNEFDELLEERGICIIASVKKYANDNSIVNEFLTYDFHDYVNDLEYCSYSDQSSEDSIIHYKVNDKYYFLSNNSVTFTELFDPKSTNGIGNTIDKMLSIINSDLESTESVIINDKDVYYKCIFKDGIIYEYYGLPSVIAFNDGEYTYVLNVSNTYFGLNENMFHILDHYEVNLPEYDELGE